MWPMTPTTRSSEAKRLATAWPPSPEHRAVLRVELDGELGAADGDGRAGGQGQLRAALLVDAQRLDAFARQGGGEAEDHGVASGDGDGRAASHRACFGRGFFLSRGCFFGRRFGFFDRGAQVRAGGQLAGAELIGDGREFVLHVGRDDIGEVMERGQANRAVVVARRRHRQSAIWLMMSSRPTGISFMALETRHAWASGTVSHWSKSTPMQYSGLSAVVRFAVSARPPLPVLPPAEKSTSAPWSMAWAAVAAPHSGSVKATSSPPGW